MGLWYVEYRDSYNKQQYMNKIEAKDGNEAIEYVKSKVIGAHRFWCDHDEDEYVKAKYAD